MKAPLKSSVSSSGAPSTREAGFTPGDGLFARLAEHAHEQVSFGYDAGSGYRGIIAIHDTTLGPSLGGTRYWNYSTEAEAVTDVLRLSRAMTYKAAVARLRLGGGKSVIIGDPRAACRDDVLRAHGRHIEALGGRYITAEDVGTTPDDMAVLRRETRHVMGLEGGSGDPSPFTALGVYRGIKACAQHRWGDDALSGRTVAVQGVGNVGYHLCRHLRDEGATLVVTDVDAEKVSRVVSELGARAVRPAEIYRARADILAPCALGGVINDQTLPRLQVEIIAGGANNQLAEERHGDLLERREITYAPDYVINAGGLISVGSELHGWTGEQVRNRVWEIFDTVLLVLRIAKEGGIPTHVAADRLGERRLAEAKV